MNIVVLQDYLRSGGTERQSLLLAQAFAAAGHRTTLLTFRPGGALANPEAGVERRVLQPFDTGFDWFAPGLVRTARTLAPDVLICMGRMANCYSGRLQACLSRTVVVATMRTGKSLPWLFRRSLQRVRHIVANCREARETLIAQHGLPAGRISVIYNSLVFPPTASLTRNTALRAQYGAGDSTTVLLCVAMFRPEKNQRALIEIAAGLPADLDWQLWLAGDGPERVACERLATRINPAADHIKFLGWQRDPTPLYSAADIAVHASGSESLSNFLIEAQAHGLPAVAYQAQGIAECFVPGDTGFVIPRDDPAAFRARLAAFASEDAATRRSRASRAQTYARTTFDRSRQVVAYLELFAKLVSASTP
ncbi:MAG TPA: glycosyltransferase [Opitutaceae bacterium]|nr:glycosyltransferase [Opitutaceae bacterium]